MEIKYLVDFVGSVWYNKIINQLYKEDWMKRWNNKKSDNVENIKIDVFLKEIVDVCKRYGFSISHEDAQGAFKIEMFGYYNIKWLMDAVDNT